MLLSSCLLSVALVISTLLVRSNAWYLDESCTKSRDVEDMVRESVQRAMDMANHATSAVDQSPLSADISKLLVGFWGSEARGVSAVKHALGGVQRMAEEKPIPDQKTIAGLDHFDTVIYCDDSRIKLFTKENEYGFDTKSREKIPPRWTVGCKAGLACAWTNKPRNPLLPSQIILCPWFVKAALAQKYKTTEGLNLDGLVNSLRKAFAKVKFAPIDIMSTDVDVLSLFDKVMLHEFTHTRDGGETQDPAYGWKNCRSIAKDQTDLAAEKYGSDMNADTYALFGTACFLLTKGITINDDGSINKAPAPAPARMMRRAFQDLEGQNGSLPELVGSLPEAAYPVEVRVK